MSDMFGYLKRRFSSGDLQGELADKREQEGLPGFLTNITSSGQQAFAKVSNFTSQHGAGLNSSQSSGINKVPDAPQGNSFQTPQHQSSYQQNSTSGQNFPKKATYPSAPASPTRGQLSGFPGPGAHAPLQTKTHVQQNSTSGTGFMGGIGGSITRGIFSAANQVRDKAAAVSASTIGKDRSKVILVIDDSSTDWSKYFRGRKVNDQDVRVEQASFAEISITAHSDLGCICHVSPYLGSTPGALSGTFGKSQVRSFRPDFVLIRQHCALTNHHEWESVLNGIAYANIPCLNSLQSIYGLSNRPWTFGQLIAIRNSTSREKFPLISQSFHSSNKEMTNPPNLPAVIKFGNCYFGEGKIRVENIPTYQDVASMVSITQGYVTIENYVDARYDMQLQKIGNHYKAYSRKSVSGSWKSNVGSSIIEKAVVTEKFKLWLDETSKIFGGLDICALELLVSKTGDHFIYGARGSDMPLFGDSQEDDRRDIAEIVLTKFQTYCTGTSISQTISLQSIAGDTSNLQTVTDHHKSNIHPTANAHQVDKIYRPKIDGSSNVSSVSSNYHPPSNNSQPTAPTYTNPVNQVRNTGYIAAQPSSSTATTGALYGAPKTSPNPQPRSDFSSTQESYGGTRRPPPPMNNTGSFSSSSGPPPTISGPQRQLTMTSPSGSSISSTSTGVNDTGNGAEDPDDTMKNLRKTFAGIFGDM